MHRLPHLVSTALRTIAFWAAIVLPLAYVPALVDLLPTVLFLAIIPVHVLCLVVGHEHRPRSRLVSPTKS